MSKLSFMEKLLDGAVVEWKPLGEVIKLEKGKQLNKESLSDNGKYPAFNGGISYSGFTDNYNYSENTIIISQGGASAGFVNFVTSKFYANAHCYVVLPKTAIVENRYIYHFLKLNQAKLTDNQHGAGIPALRTSEILSLATPIPPLHVQAEIVRILDKFTALTTELTTELKMRKQQYKYYRDKLLTFEEAIIPHASCCAQSQHPSTDEARPCDYAQGDGLDGVQGDKKRVVEWKTLGEVAEYSTTRIRFDRLNDTNYVGVDNLLQNQAGKTNSNYVPNAGNLTEYVNNDILIGNIRPYLKKIWQADRVGGTNGDVLVIHLIDEKINPRYLYQVLADDKFFDYNMQYAKGAKMPRGNKSEILKFQIPIPSLAEQARIVAILDKFDTLTNSLTEGLPREIKLRQQQYEYYRNLLLSFPKE